MHYALLYVLRVFGFYVYGTCPFFVALTVFRGRQFRRYATKTPTAQWPRHTPSGGPKKGGRKKNKSLNRPHTRRRGRTRMFPIRFTILFRFISTTHAPIVGRRSCVGMDCTINGPNLFSENILSIKVRQNCFFGFRSNAGDESMFT